MKKWFIIPPLLLLFVTIGFIGHILINASVSSTHLILRELHQQMQKQVDTELTQRLKTATQLNQMHYDHLRCGLLDLSQAAEREQYFSNHLKIFPDVAMTFIGQSDGSFYGARRVEDDEIQVVRNNSATNGGSWYYKTNSSGEGIKLVEKFPDFDPRTRPWYTEAAEAGEPIFSSVYSHFIFREPTITASYPVYDRTDKLVGVFGANYLLSWLGDTLGSLPIGDSGQVFVIDGSGMLVASTLDMPSYKIVDGGSELIPISEVHDALVQTALAIQEYENKDRLPKISVLGEDYYVGFSEYREYGLDWDIYVVMAEVDFFGGVNEAIIQAITIMVCSLLLSVVITTFIAGRMVKPIISLSAAAEELSEGKLSAIPDKGRKDEIGSLTRTFNEMGRRISQTVVHLEETVTQRTQELEERNKELKLLSFTDGLTGIPNRRKFDESLKSAWNTALRYGWRIGLFMIDVDLFKNYNDTYGHQTGDDSLRAIGKLIYGKVMRSTDLAARFGGEEFVVLILDTRPEGLMKLAEDIRSGVEALDIEHSSSPFKKVTISIGLAHMLPSPDTEPETLIHMADKALYQAKNSGRNMVVENIESE